MDPQAAAVLERQRRIGLRPLSERPLWLLRLLERVASRLRNRDPPAVGATTDGTIPGPDGGLDVRVYRPEGPGPFPTVAFFHGGGYLLGSLASHDLLCRHLTRESGRVVVSVDYRLAPEHPFPAAVEDAYAATEWIAAHPERLAGDGRLAVAGDSAGGALAAIVALMARERDGPAIDRQALLYPGVGVDPDQESVEAFDGIVLSRADLEWFRDAYFGSDVHLRNPYADPIRTEDLSGVAPATVLTAGFDPLRDGGRAYAAALEADGVPVRHVEYDDQIHGFASQPDRIDRARAALADVAADLPAP